MGPLLPIDVFIRVIPHGEAPKGSLQFFGSRAGGESEEEKGLGSVHQGFIIESRPRVWQWSFPCESYIHFWR